MELFCIIVAVQPVYRIEVKNNNISCEEATLTHSNTILTCRNLWLVATPPPPAPSRAV